jgi:hypothetical protein
MRSATLVLNTYVQSGFSWGQPETNNTCYIPLPIQKQKKKEWQLDFHHSVFVLNVHHDF